QLNQRERPRAAALERTDHNGTPDDHLRSKSNWLVVPAFTSARSSVSALYFLGRVSRGWTLTPGASPSLATVLGSGAETATLYLPEVSPLALGTSYLPSVIGAPPAGEIPPSGMNVMAPALTGCPLYWTVPVTPWRVGPEPPQPTAKASTKTRANPLH